MILFHDDISKREPTRLLYSVISILYISMTNSIRTNSDDKVSLINDQTHQLGDHVNPFLVWLEQLYYGTSYPQE